MARRGCWKTSLYFDVSASQWNVGHSTETNPRGFRKNNRPYLLPGLSNRWFHWRHFGSTDFFPLPIEKIERTRFRPRTKPQRTRPSDYGETHETLANVSIKVILGIAWKEKIYNAGLTIDNFSLIRYVIKIFHSCLHSIVRIFVR